MRCTFFGFFEPLEAQSNTISSSRSLPIKFSLSGDYGVTGILANGYPRLVPCAPSEVRVSTAATDYSTVTDPAGTLKYDRDSDEYITVFQVKGKMTTGQCKKLELKLSVCPDKVHTTLLYATK